MKKILSLAIFLMGLCPSLFAATGWPPPVDFYMVYEWEAGKGDRAYQFGEIVYFNGGFYEVVNPMGVHSYGAIDSWSPEALSVISWDNVSPDGTPWEGTADYVKVAEGKLWEAGMAWVEEGNFYIWESVVYECIKSGESWSAEYFSPTSENAGSYKKVCEITMVPVDEGCLPDNFVGYFYRSFDFLFKKGWIGINWETKLAYECVSQTHLFDGESGGEWPGTQYGYWAYEPGAWNDPPIPTCEEKDLLTTVDIPEWYECNWPLGAIVQYKGVYYLFNKLDEVIYYPSDQDMTIESVLETTPTTNEVPGTGSNWTVYNPGGPEGPTGWPPPSDKYMVYEWEANKGDRAYKYGKIVYFNGGFYEVANPMGVHSYGDVDSWSPEALSITSWDNVSPDGTPWEGTADYVKVAEGKFWVTNMETIEEGMNYIWKGAVYECILSGESWGDGFAPDGWNASSYKKVCEITLVSIDEDCLPDNFVGYFYRSFDSFFKKGWIGINWDTKLAYECVTQTHPYDSGTETGGEWPGTQYGYWAYEPGAWNDPPVPVCDEKDLLTTVDIPEWHECEWPLGAIVQYEGTYYIFNKLDDVIYYPSDQDMTIESVLETTPLTGEVPGTGSDWTVYTGDTKIDDTLVLPFTYSVQNGRLVVKSDTPVSIQLYNLIGQTVSTVVGESVELPAKGAYIAKINTGGKITTVKVLK